MAVARTRLTVVRPVAVALIVALVGAVAPSALAQKGGGPGNKTVYALAVDNDLKPVSDVTKEEVGVREDGQDRTVVDVKPASDPFDIVLIVDTTKSINNSINELRSGLKIFCKTIFDGNPGATISVIDVANASVMVAKDKKSSAELDKTLGQTFGDTAQTVVVLEAIVDAAKKLAKSPSPRRAIVIVNLDGIPESSSIEPPKVVDEIIAANVSLWGVTYSNELTKNIGSKNANNGQKRDFILTKVLPATGGVRPEIVLESALSNTLEKLATMMTSQYAVTYVRPEGPMPKALQMGVGRAGVRLAYSTVIPK